MKSDVTFTAHFKQSSENPDDSEITTVEIIGATLSYKTGDTPKATAAVAAADQGKYRIADEWWQELNENDVPVAIWHSDGEIYSTLPTITAFESGKKYVYSVLLMPEREYDFSREVAATVNGNAVTTVPATDRYLSLPNVKTITPTGQITPPATGGYYYSPSAGGSNASPKTADAGMALYSLRVDTDRGTPQKRQAKTPPFRAAFLSTAHTRKNKRHIGGNTLRPANRVILGIAQSAEVGVVGLL